MHDERQYGAEEHKPPRALAQQFFLLIGSGYVALLHAAACLSDVLHELMRRVEANNSVLRQSSFGSYLTNTTWPGRDSSCLLLALPVQARQFEVGTLLMSW